jgi:hypothetical protein
MLVRPRTRSSSERLPSPSLTQRACHAGRRYVPLPAVETAPDDVSDGVSDPGRAGLVAQVAWWTAFSASRGLLSTSQDGVHVQNKERPDGSGAQRSKADKHECRYQRSSLLAGVTLPAWCWQSRESERSGSPIGADFAERWPLRATARSKRLRKQVLSIKPYWRCSRGTSRPRPVTLQQPPITRVSLRMWLNTLQTTAGPVKSRSAAVVAITSSRRPYSCGRPQVVSRALTSSRSRTCTG